jgi:hypothetical protein
MADITDRVSQLVTTPVVIGIASPFLLPAIPAAIVAGLTAITFSPSDLAQYYRQIHESFLMMNEAIAHVKSSPCWTPEATDGWRNLRDAWIRFYSSGPSKWWVLSGDKAKADEFARGLVWWRDNMAKACGQSSVAPVQAPVSNPFFLQPLPAADPDVVASVQLRKDNEALEEAIRKLKLEPPVTQIPWGWIGLFGVGAVAAVILSNRR